MDIWTLIITNYPETVQLFAWLVIFALSAAALLLLVHAFNVMGKEATDAQKHRKFRSESKEFYHRHPEMAATEVLDFTLLRQQ